MRRMSRRVSRVGPSSSSAGGFDFGLEDGVGFAVDGWDGSLLLLLLVGMLVLERRFEDAMVVEGGSVVSF